MNISWSNELINELIEIVSYLKKNELGELLEYLGNYFISKHIKYGNIENYKMIFLFTNESISVSEGEYRLAFICELNNNKFLKLKDKKHTKRFVKRFENVYSSFSYMINYCINDKIKIIKNNLTFKSFYILSILKDNVLPEKKILNKDDPILDVLHLPYYLVLQMINIENVSKNIIYSLNSLVVASENLDISLLSTSSLRACLEILNTKRTIFVRFLLVLTYEILKFENLLEPDWLLQILNFKNKEQFLSTMNSPLLEATVFITSHEIYLKS